MREIIHYLSERDPRKAEACRTPLSAFRTKWLFPFTLPPNVRATDETTAGEIVYYLLQLLACLLREFYQKLGLLHLLLSPPCGGLGLEDKQRVQEARGWLLLETGLERDPTSQSPAPGPPTQPIKNRAQSVEEVLHTLDPVKQPGRQPRRTVKIGRCLAVAVFELLHRTLKAQVSQWSTLHSLQ